MIGGLAGLVLGNMRLPAAVSIAASAGRGIKAISTTPLLSVTEGVIALQLAHDLGYESPVRDAELQTPMYAG